MTLELKIKLLVLISTIVVGFFYTRKEIKALWKCITERDYLSLYELNREVARREISI